MSTHNGARSHASEVAAAHKSRIAAGNASRLAAAGLALFLTFGFTGVAQADAGEVPDDNASTQAVGVDNAGHAADKAIEKAADAKTTTAPAPTPPGGEAGATDVVTAAATPSAEVTSSQLEPVLETEEVVEFDQGEIAQREAEAAIAARASGSSPVRVVKVAAPGGNGKSNQGGAGADKGNKGGKGAGGNGGNGGGHEPRTFCHNGVEITTDRQGEINGHIRHGDPEGTCGGEDTGGDDNGDGDNGDGDNGDGDNGDRCDTVAGGAVAPGDDCGDADEGDECDTVADGAVAADDECEDEGERDECDTVAGGAVGAHDECEDQDEGDPDGGEQNPGGGNGTPGGTPGGNDVENPLPGEGDDVEGPAGPGKSKPGKPGRGGKADKGDDEVLGDDTDKPRDKGGKPGSNGGDPEGDPGFPDEILGVDDTPVAKRPATVLPQTGAAENMAIQAGAGLTLLLAGALLLVGRRRQTDR